MPSCLVFQIPLNLSFGGMKEDPSKKAFLTDVLRVCFRVTSHKVIGQARIGMLRVFYKRVFVEDTMSISTLQPFFYGSVLFWPAGGGFTWGVFNFVRKSSSYPKKNCYVSNLWEPHEDAGEYCTVKLKYHEMEMGHKLIQVE